MVEIVITYETLFDILRKEKSRDELQELPEDFYGQVVAYVRQKMGDVQSAGGFSAPRAQKALVQLRNVQKILRELYERRERKVLEMALNRARTESNIIDTSVLLTQERDFFEAAASLLKRTRSDVLLPVLEGNPPPGVEVVARPVVEEKKSVAEDAAEEAENAVAPTDSSVADADVASGDTVTTVETPVKKEIPLTGDCAVKFLVKMPRFLGLGGKVHGPFSPGEEAELPAKIAAVLVKKRRAELL